MNSLLRLPHFHKRFWNNPWCMICIIILYGCFFTLHFIYTAPGKANAYLYWLEHMLDKPKNVQYELRNIHETSSFVPDDFAVLPDSVCPERFPEMSGQIQIDMSEITMNKINSQFSSVVSAGGKWAPKECLPKWNIAIMIPFRNRFEHLPILLRHIIPMLIAQRLKFTIFTADQGGTELFNRAMLLNVGFIEAMKRDSFDCIVFHDVDLIPENNRNYYGCNEMPRLFREKLDIYGYRLEYPTFFGGVSGVTANQFKKVNGFSNQFWGWGGEDDDFYQRIKLAGLNISRPPSDYGRYSSIVRHHKQERQGLFRFSLLKHTKERNFVDGLNSIQYSTPQITINPLYTNISVILHRVENIPFPT